MDKLDAVLNYDYNISIPYRSLTVDEDECRGTAYNNCEQQCVNSVGSFTCTCNTGYVLDDNGYSCSGKLHNKH